MDRSTDGVTLLSGFVFDVLAEYENKRVLCEPAFALAKDLDKSNPGEFCSIEIYNSICDWIENKVGEASVRLAGIAIGSRSYEGIVQMLELTDPSPVVLLEALSKLSHMDVMIRDPKLRGWDVIEKSPTSVLMRLTQTFNCILQEGLLPALVERTGVEGVEVAHEKCTRRGDEFCDFRLSWMS